MLEDGFLGTSPIQPGFPLPAEPMPPQGPLAPEADRLLAGQPVPGLQSPLLPPALAKSSALIAAFSCTTERKEEKPPTYVVPT